jgi:hypothetical protein
MVIIPELLYDGESVQSTCGAAFLRENEQLISTCSAELTQKNIFDIRIGI